MDRKSGNGGKPVDLKAKWNRWRPVGSAETMAAGLALWFAAVSVLFATPMAVEGIGGTRALWPMGVGVVTGGLLGGAGMLFAAFGGGGFAVEEYGRKRGGWRVLAWWLAGALPALVLGCAWNGVLAAPAAWRRGDRRGTAAAAGAVLLGGVALATRFSRDVRAGAWPVPLWAVTALNAVSAALLLRGLWRLGGRADFLRRTAWTMAALAAAGLALWPGWRVGRQVRRAEDAMAALWAETEWPGGRAMPPVAEADDPVAALDATALEASEGEWHRFAEELDAGRRPGCPAYPLADAECAAAEAWLAAHPDALGKAVAVSSPGYRSCLPGAAAPEDYGPEGIAWLEPRLDGCLDWCRPLLLRAAVALARGDTAAAMTDIRLVHSLAERLMGEGCFIGQLMGGAVADMLPAVAGQRFDLWTDGELEALAALAGSYAGAAERSWRLAVGNEAAFFDGCLRVVEADFAKTGIVDIDGEKAEGMRMASPTAPRPSQDFVAFRHWMATERLAYARGLLRLHRSLAAALALPAGPERAAALSALKADAGETEKRLPHLAALCFPTVDGFVNLGTHGGNHASAMRAAVAVERWRRAHGGALPESLEVLVPDWLDAVPSDGELGAPLHLEKGEDGRSFAIRRPEGAGRRQFKGWFRVGGGQGL